MTDDASPKKTRPNYSRPAKYPATVNAMTTETMRRHIDEIAETRDMTLGAAVRSVLALGLDLDEALDVSGTLAAEIEQLAREANVVRSEALGTLLRFAVDESKRRVERNAKLAASVAQDFADHGFALDGVEATGVSFRAE